VPPVNCHFPVNETAGQFVVFSGPCTRRNSPARVSSSRELRADGPKRENQVRADLPRYFGGDFGLQNQNISKVVIVSFRPQVTAGRGVNQLRRDAHSVI